MKKCQYIHCTKNEENCRFDHVYIVFSAMIALELLFQMLNNFLYWIRINKKFVFKSNLWYIIPNVTKDKCLQCFTKVENNACHQFFAKDDVRKKGKCYTTFQKKIRCLWHSDGRQRLKKF